MNFKSPRVARAFSLIEIMLAIVILMAGVLGVYYLFDRSQSNAAVEQEQRQLNSLIEGIQGQYMASADFADLTTDTVINSRLPGLRISGDELSSGFNTPVEVRSATTVEADDSFEVVYRNLSTAQCLKLIPALYSKSHDVLVGEGDNPTTSVQETTGSNTGRLQGEDVLLDACSQNAFASNQGTVVFRVYAPRNVDDTPPTGVGCTCAPQTENQTIVCPAGQVGSIVQQRTSDCSGGTPSCPTAVWSAWSTTNNTCAPVVTPPPAPPPVTPPAATCVASTITRLTACPSGQTGQITEQLAYTCATPTSAPAAGLWTEIARTCMVVTPPAAACVPSTETQYLACGGGEGGQIVQQRSTTCPSATGTPVTGPWIETSRTCTASCLISGNCCTPSYAHQTIARACADGTWGGPLSIDQEQTSFCSSATATPAWGGWYDINSVGTCTSCQPSTTQSETQWASGSATCPSGQTGSHTWEDEQIRTRAVTYECTPAPSSAPAPTYGTWGAWSNTGARRNEFNTCAAPPSGGCSVQTGFNSQTLDATDPTLDPAGSEASCGNFTTWEATCAAGSTCTQTDRPGSGGSGWKTIYEVEYTCTGACAPPPPCTGPSTQSQWVSRSAACPTGQTGSNTWEAEQVQSRVCNSGVWGAWGMWSDTGATRNVVNTCVAAPVCSWVNSTGNNSGALGSGTSASSMGVGVIVDATAANNIYFAPPSWTTIYAGQTMGTGNGSNGGGVPVPAGKIGYSRLYLGAPNASGTANLNQAQSLIGGFNCQPGDQWFLISGFSGQSSYCSCP